MNETDFLRLQSDQPNVYLSSSVGRQRQELVEVATLGRRVTDRRNNLKLSRQSCEPCSLRPGRGVGRFESFGSRIGVRLREDVGGGATSSRRGSGSTAGYSSVVAV